MISFSCSCGKVLAAEEKHAGMMITCPQCGKQCQVPGATANIQSTPPPTQQTTGQPYAPQGPPGDYPRRRPGPDAQTTSGMAVTAFVLGLLSFCVPVLLSLAAIICGIIGLTQTGGGKQKGRGYAVTGLILGVFTTLLMPAVMIALLLPAVQKVREAAARQASSNNMKQIGLAVHSYNDSHGRLPTVATFQGNKKQPLLSWRVEILPYIEQMNLYKQFNHNEPWDSPHNKTLISQMPKTYYPPSADPKDLENGLTYYRVFCSEPRPNALSSTMFSFGPRSAYKLTTMPDGTSNTLMVVEATEPVIWTKPEPLRFSPNGPLPSLGLPQNYYFLVGFGDGSVRSFRKNELDERTMRNMIQADDGNALNLPR